MRRKVTQVFCKSKGFYCGFFMLVAVEGAKEEGGGGEVDLRELPGVIIFQHSVICGRGIRQD